MASIKVKFRPSALEEREGTIYYQIIHDRKVRQLISDHRVFPSEWDENRSMVVAGPDSGRRPFLMSVRENIRCDLERLAKIDRRLDDCGLPYTVDDVIDAFRLYLRDYSLFSFMERIIGDLRFSHRLRTSETYRSALNSFRKFRGGKDLMLDRITPATMEAFEAWHRQRGLAPNTISFYTRILRAVYNRAVEIGVIDNSHPFRRVYTGIDKTVKRALPIQTIRRIKSLELPRNSSLDYARDMFIMSFMLRGMSFIDMAFLRKSDRTNGYVTYRRHKTGQQLTIEWTIEMQTILDKYPDNESDYLLPIIRRRGTNERSTYRNVGYNINHNLKTIGRMAGIAMPLTLYVARHSWASAAKAKGIPLSVISEGMGHDSETTTRIYLASLETSVVDKANSLILQCI